MSPGTTSEPLPRHMERAGRVRRVRGGWKGRARHATHVGHWGYTSKFALTWKMANTHKTNRKNRFGSLKNPRATFPPRATWGTHDDLGSHGQRNTYRTITGDRGVPHYGLNGVLRVLLCGINGTRDLVVQRTAKAPATVARTMLQPISDERLAATICTCASLNNKKANNKGKVRMECAACYHTLYAEQGRGKGH